MTSFVQSVADFIEQEKLFAPDDRLLLAVSGGMDSMVLWRVLQELGYNFAVAHCNFQLRGDESEADEHFVTQEAAQGGLKCHIDRYATKELAQASGKSIQEIARNLRYEFFEQLCETEGYKYVLTAHHIDDRIETFWLNFSRGSGLQGLASLRPKRGRIRRPLLGVNRTKISAYQTEKAIPYREDSSNAEDKYRRNAFRHTVLPTLYDWAPDLSQAATRNFSLLEQLSLLLSERIEEYRQCLLEVGEGGTLVFRKEEIADHPARFAITYELLREFGFTTEQCQQLFTARIGAILSSSSYELLVREKSVELQSRIAEKTDGLPAIWLQTASSFSVSTEVELYYKEVVVPDQIPRQSNEAWLDADELLWPLEVRYWQAGDRFCPLGMEGREQKLQDFFTNNKISQFRRREIPLLVNGDGRIIWIAGLRLDDRFKLSEETKRAAHFQLRPTN